MICHPLPLFTYRDGGLGFGAVIWEQQGCPLAQRRRDVSVTDRKWNFGNVSAMIKDCGGSPSRIEKAWQVARLSLGAALLAAIRHGNLPLPSVTETYDKRCAFFERVDDGVFNACLIVGRTQGCSGVRLGQRTAIAAYMHG
jgi:hypothetical protein